MRVEFGNVAPHHKLNGVDEPLPGPAVTTLNIPADYTYVVAEEGSEHRFGPESVETIETAAELAQALGAHIANRWDGLTHLPDHEAFLAAHNCWSGHSTAAPSWVASDDEDFATLLGAHFGCPVGKPEDVEDTHFTASGPPGVGPVVAPEESA